MRIGANGRPQNDALLAFALVAPPEERPGFRRDERSGQAT